MKEIKYLLSFILNMISFAFFLSLFIHVKDISLVPKVLYTAGFIIFQLIYLFRILKFKMDKKQNILFVLSIIVLLFNVYGIIKFMGY